MEHDRRPGTTSQRRPYATRLKKRVQVRGGSSIEPTGGRGNGSLRSTRTARRPRAVRGGHRPSRAQSGQPRNPRRSSLARTAHGRLVRPLTKCRARDIRNVARANDAGEAGGPARPMDHGERGESGHRRAITLGVVGALLVAPSVASAANVPQSESQVVDRRSSSRRSPSSRSSGWSSPAAALVTSQLTSTRGPAS